jgi:hypothetical protein
MAGVLRPLPSLLRPRYPVRSERLLLRPLAMGDADGLLAYRSREDVCRYVPLANVVENLFLPNHLLTRHVQGLQHKLSCAPCSPLTARKWLERLIDAEGSQKLVGWAGVHRTTIR